MDAPTPTLRLDSSDASILRAADILRGGGLVAIPTETVYGLAAVAQDAAAVERIFVAKGRPHWDPLIVHVEDEAMVQAVTAGASDADRQLMQAFWPGPLTLLLPRTPALPTAVTAGRELVGVRMPAHPVARRILRATGRPLAAPSANLFGHVSPTTPAHVLADLDGRIDALVDAGPTTIGLESTVVHCTPTEVILYRAGGITAADIEQATGLPVRTYTPPAAAALPQSLPSPGVGMRHYATRARVVLVRSNEHLAALVREPAHRLSAVLLPADWQLPGHAGAIHTWARTDDPAGLAATLYSALRQLDAHRPDTILVPLPPQSDGLYAALRDRLEKAARSA